MAFFMALCLVSSSLSAASAYSTLDTIDQMLSSLEQRLIVTESELRQVKDELMTVSDSLRTERESSQLQLEAYNRLFSRYEKLERSSRLFRSASEVMLVIIIIESLLLALQMHR